MHTCTSLRRSRVAVAGSPPLLPVISVALPGRGISARAGDAVGEEPPALATELRRNTQMLLDAIAPGNVVVWDSLLDPAVLQVDENDVVRTKPEILADLKP